MIVVCTGCSAKFRVADEKVGPRGAKLRCSRCQTVFSVRRDATPAPPELVAASPPAPAPPRAPQRPPVPPSAAPAPAPDTGPQFAVDPFAVIAGLDRLPYHPARPPAPPAPSPFEIDLDPPGLPPVDPFVAPAEPQAAEPPRADDPFAQQPDPFPGTEPFPPLRDEPQFDGAAGSAHLSLEEQTTPPPRKARAGALGVSEPSLLGMHGMATGMEDPFASVAPLEPGEPHLGGGEGGLDALSLPGLDSGLPGVSESPAEPLAPSGPQLLQVDPFGAAAAKAPLLADEHPGAEPGESEQAPPETTAERRAAGSSTLRAVAVNAVSLVALLLLTLAIWLGWRGGLSPQDALRPTTIVAALRQQPAGGPLVTGQVSSGFYERQRGSPLVFVRGTVASAAPAPLEAVKVSVELLRDGRVLAHSEVPVGAVLGPETLYGIADAPALARAAAEAANGSPGRLQPGEVAPFLVAFVDEPGDLAGATVRVSASAGTGK